MQNMHPITCGIMALPLHTSIPPLPKNPCACFPSPRLCVFLCMPEFLFAFTFSPKQGKGKHKQNQKIKGAYRLSGFWSSIIFMWVKCMCFFKSVIMCRFMFTAILYVIICNKRGNWQGLTLPACSHQDQIQKYLALMQCQPIILYILYIQNSIFNNNINKEK